MTALNLAQTSELLLNIWHTTPSKTGQDRCNAEDFRGPCSAKWYDQLTIERLLKGRVTRPSWTLVCLEVAPRYGLRTRR
jgi:hypothetical protein